MDASSWIWIAVFAATFYLSRSACRPFPAQLTFAWIGLAVALAFPVLSLFLDLVNRLPAAGSQLALAGTVIALLLYFNASSSRAGAEPLSPPQPPRE